MTLIEVEPSPDRPPTPPHFPTYNVHCSPARIFEIVGQIFPDENLERVRPLPSGQSFNNRIYFLELRSKSNTASATAASDLVLKISGQFFGPAKVQNEVSCLLLLEKHCPEIPTPRIIAWSGDGTEYMKVIREGPDIRVSQPSTLSRVQGEDHGWILVTHLPGRTLQPKDLQSHGDTIMRQLAHHVSKMRTIPSPSQDIGNLLISISNSTPSSQEQDQPSSSSSQIQIETKGLLIAGTSPSHPLSSPLQYQTYKLSDQLSILESEPVFSPNKAKLSPLIQNLISHILPVLPLFSSPSSSTNTPPIFTHYDLSPRNILVSSIHSPSTGPLTPLITGLLDLEFAGFFPPQEEFTNSRVTHSDYWTDSAWEAFTSELERLGEHVPSGEEWEQAAASVEIVEGIAPWYLREGGVQGAELEKELERVEGRVRRAVERLEGYAKARVKGHGE